LVPADYLSAYARMNSGTGIAPRVSADIGAQAPDDKFVRATRPLENLGVVTVQTAFQIDNRGPSILQLHDIIMQHATFRAVPIRYKSAIFHMIEHVLDKFSLLSHRGRKFSAHLLDSAAEYRGSIEIFLRKPVISEFVGLRFNYLNELFDLKAQAWILLAWDNAHAAFSAAAQTSRSGSNR
jgi:hypothetical protein